MKPKTLLLFFIIFFSGEVINNVINQNFETFSQELFPAIERELSKLFTEVTNNIVSEYTYNQLLPPS